MRISFLLSLSLIACVPAYKVIKLAPENPFATAQAKVSVEALSFEGVRVGQWPEQAYLERFAGRPEVATYPADKVEMDKNFRDGLSKEVADLLGAAPQPFTLRARALRLVPGQQITSNNPTGNLAANTQGTYEVQLVSSDGNVLDAIEVEVGVAGDTVNADAGQRMRQLGTKLAETVSGYLKERATKKTN